MDTEKISFHIISYAGDSFSKMREALSEAKLGNFQKADELMSSAKKTLTEAHNVHTEVITLEAQVANNLGKRMLDALQPDKE